MYLLLLAKSYFLVVSLAIKSEFYFFVGEFERNDRNVLLDPFAMKHIFSFKWALLHYPDLRRDVPLPH